MQSYIVALSDTVEGDAFPKYIEDRFSQEGFGVERVEASQSKESFVSRYSISFSKRC